MAEERIDIEVNDKVDASIPTKLREIAAQAERGETFVNRLKNALASVNATPLTKLAAASAANTNALAREITATAKLTAAQANASVATARAATEKQRLATETLRTAAAQSRADSAQASAARSALALEQATQRAAAAKGNLAARAHSLKAALDPAYAAQSRFNAEMAEARTLLDAGAINMRTYVSAVQAATARLNGLTPAANGATMALGAVGRGAKGTGHHTANVAAQMNDLGVQFAMAAQSSNPLQMVFMALIQQGSQLSYIASTMQGGWAGVGKLMGGMVLRFLPLIAVIGVLIGIVKTMQSEFNKANANIQPFVDSLGLTKDELKELGDTSITVTDTLLGFYDTFMQMTGLNSVVDSVANFFSEAWDKSLTFIRLAFVGFYGLVVGGMRAIAETIIKLPEVAAATAKAIANAAIAAVEWAVNKAIQGVNALVSPVRSILSAVGMDVGEFSQVTFGRFTMTAEDSANTLSAVFNRQVTGAIREADSTLTQFTRNWERAADARRRSRLREKANEIIADRPEEKAKKAGRVARDPAEVAAERRAHALSQVNLQLDNELARMRMLKDERAIEQRMDQITEALAQKKITLNDQEAASIRAKVTEIERFKYVQSEMDRIVETSIGPQRTLNAATEAATMLYRQGTIDLATYNAELAKAQRAYAEATDPLFRFNEQLESAQRLTGLYGVELERANYLEQIRQEYAARGLSLYDATTGKLRDEVAQLVAKNDALRQQQFLQTQLGGVLNPILDQQREIAGQQAVYAELDRLRNQDLINEDAYQRAKSALWVKYNEMRLSATSDFFGALASVTKDGHGAVGAISKAAAIAQATIDGYVAVQKALASAPPPFNYIAAAAVAIKTGTQVAGIMSTNVGSYKDGGQFVVKGRDGVDANNINMNVTKGERVTIETAKQQRANDNQAGASPVVNANTKVVNLFDEKEFIGAMDSDEGERVVMNIIRRNPGGIQAALQR